MCSILLYNMTMPVIRVHILLPSIQDAEDACRNLPENVELHALLRCELRTICQTQTCDYVFTLSEKNMLHQSRSYLNHLVYHAKQYICNLQHNNSSRRNNNGRLRGRGSSPGRVKNFLFSKSSRPALGSTQPPIQWVPGVKRLGREVDHSPPTSAEVKKMWTYTSTPTYAFMA
jgi:hypothetical protein